jgi:hypothetical protein
MRPCTRLLLLIGLSAAVPYSLLAQSAVDPSGHWEGTIETPETELRIEIDLTKGSKGELAGTFAQPAQGVKGFPLSALANEGRLVRFVLKAAEQPSTFRGELAVDGTSITGTVTQAGYTVPFTLARTGDARVTPTPKSAAVGRELEGTWRGTLAVGTKQMRLILSIANHSDGTAAGTIVSPDGSGVEIPIAITQRESRVTIDVPSVGASYVGVANAAGTELVGTWTQQGTALPLTFERAAK